MKQFDYYKVEIFPYNFSGLHGGVERIYEITIEMNGKKIQHRTPMIPNVPSYMTELDYVAQMTKKIIQKLQEDENTSSR